MCMQKRWCISSYRPRFILSAPHFTLIQTSSSLAFFSLGKIVQMIKTPRTMQNGMHSLTIAMCVQVEHDTRAFFLVE